MAITLTDTSNYVEGADRVRRVQIVGDTSYPTGGYDVLTARKTTANAAGLPPAVIKRIMSVRHRTVASASVGTIVLVDTYSNGVISALNLALVSGNAELTAGTSTANLNIEVAYEGY